MQGNLHVRFGGGQREKQVKLLALCLPYWLAPHVVRVARFLYESKGSKVAVSFIDPDTVEMKNVFRQNFSEAEIGGRKAELLATRYAAAWARGIDVQSISTSFDKQMIQLEYRDLGVIVGCVDNADARKEISQAIEIDANKRGPASLPRLWWLDCGNGMDTGQVLLGAARNVRDLRYAFPCTPDQGFCVNLPAPHLQHPELLERQSETTKSQATGRELSCANHAVLGDQSASINSLVANLAASYLWQMYTDPRGLTTFATYCNLQYHSARSRFITPDEVADVIGKSCNWFRRPEPDSRTS